MTAARNSRGAGNRGYTTSSHLLFFFQAEDGIRDVAVTGVQTCALPISSTPYTPDHPTHPLGAYGQSKLAGEIAVKAQSRRHAIIRTSWVFSHRGHNFVRTMIGKMSAGHTLKVVDDQSGRPTAAGDLADALLVVAQDFHEDRSLSGTWHFANAGATTWYEFAGTIFEMRGGSAAQLEPIDSAGYPTSARRPPCSVLDTTSFEHTFGVTPRHWRDALRDTLEKMS